MRKICVILIVVLLFVSTLSCACSKKKAPGADDPVETAAREETAKPDEPTITETEEEEMDIMRIDLPDLPVPCRYESLGEVDVIELTYTSEYVEESESFDIEFEYKCEVTNREGGFYGFSWKLLEDGAIIVTNYVWYMASLDEGDIFKGKFGVTGVPLGHYELKVTDYKG